MSAKQEDKVFFKTFGIVMAIVGVIAVTGLVAALVIGSSSDYEGLRPEQVMLTKKRTDPVYRVITEATVVQAVSNAGEAGEGAGHAMKSGEEVFKSVCHTCHVPGLMGAPQVSNTAAWKQRLSKGIQTLYKHAIHGFKAMPPKGGNPNLSNKEVKAAVDYILRRAGVK